MRTTALESKPEGSWIAINSGVLGGILSGW